MERTFNTDCLSEYTTKIKESRNFVTITVKTPNDREQVYFEIGEYVVAQNCHSERVLKQNISSVPYLLING